MRLAFLLGSPDISGGTNVIFEHGTRLQGLGHTVTMVTEEVIDAARYSWHPAASELTWRTFGELDQQMFDLAIATWWQSVYQLHRVCSREYLYFIQSIESRFFPSQADNLYPLWDINILRDWCENTYRVKLPVITEAEWIQQYLLQHHNSPSLLVRNGIRKDIYCADGPAIAARKAGHLRVLVEGPLGVFYKNVERTVELCQQADVAEIWLLTSSDIDSYPGVSRCFSRVPVEKTVEIYRSCDVLVKLSYVEGMFGPPLEMFHCGGTAVVYDVTGHDEYIRHEENSLVVQRDNEEEVVAWLQRLKDDVTLLDTLKSGALETAAQWPDWDSAAGDFNQALEKICQTGSGASPSFLEEFSDFMLAVRESGRRAREMSRFAEREAHGISGMPECDNHIQVYWDGGNGLEAELTAAYTSGGWCRCSIDVPCTGPVQFIRVDPSVRMGVVEIRSLRISGARSGETFAHWEPGSNWLELRVDGTAAILRATPYFRLSAFGEDPQIILPANENYNGTEPLRIEVEVREVGYAEALERAASGTGEKRSGVGLGASRLKDYVQRIRHRFRL